MISSEHLIGSLCLIGILWSLNSQFSFHHVKVVKERYVVSNAVKNNRFYAAEHLLNAYHRQQQKQLARPFALSKVSKPFDTLLKELPDPSTHPMIIMDNHKPLSPASVQTLLHWLAAGGQIITTGAPELPLKDWQKVQHRIKALQSQQMLPKHIIKDAEISKILEKIKSKDKYSHKNNLLLEQLGIVSVNDKTARRNNKTPAGLRFQDYLDELGLRKIKSSNYDETIELKSYVRSQLNGIYDYPGSIFLNNSDQRKFLLRSGGLFSKYLRADLLFATRPITSPRNTYKMTPVEQIKDYIKPKLQLIKQRIATLRPHYNPKKVGYNINDNGFLDGYYNITFQNFYDLKRIKASLESLLAMDAKYLAKLFLSSDNVLLDINYGKGRLVVLTDIGIFANPEINLGIMLNNAAETQAISYEDIHRISTMQGLFDSNYRRYLYKRLYQADASRFLIDITQEASQVWFVSTPSITYHAWFSPGDWFGNKPKPVIPPNGETPNELLYRIINSQHYAIRRQVTKREHIR